MLPYVDLQQERQRIPSLPLMDAFREENVGKNAGKTNFPDTKCKVKPPLKSLHGGSRKLPTVEHQEARLKVPWVHFVTSLQKLL